MTTDLTIRTTVRELVVAFEEAERDTRTAFAVLVAAQGRLASAFGVPAGEGARIDATSHGFHDAFDKPDRAIRRLEQWAWWRIVERLELRRLMSPARWDALQNQIDEHAKDDWERSRSGIPPMPPITEQTVMDFARGYQLSLPDLFAESIREVFEWLRPRHSQYKTNSEMEIGKRVILEHAVQRGLCGEYYADAVGIKIAAMENVFNALDGNGQIARQYHSDLERAIRKCKSKNTRGETTLFRFAVHKNRTLHLEFKRLDLLARFNQIAGGARLRPAKVA
jgi:hypothetical protein